MSELRLLFAEMHRPPETSMPCIVSGWWRATGDHGSTLEIVPLVTYVSDESLLDLEPEHLLPIIRRNAEARL